MKTKNLKPFNLKSALKGEPVILRNGEMAYVRHHEAELPVNDHWSLWGVAIHGSVYTLTWWTKEGRFTGDVDGSQDIIGMWPKTHMVNGFEVPAPEAEELNFNADFYLASTINVHFYRIDTWTRYNVHRNWLERGLVFLNAEDAIANAKAMLGIDPYEVKR